MSLIQVSVDEKVKKAIQKKADKYGVPASSLIKIVLVKAFLTEDHESFKAGNIFNADRDNHGQRLSIDDLISAL